MLPQPPRDAQTVPLRVQVIDMEPFALDLVVPTYIPASDLTQRIARDAGLGAYWNDGTRRLFWLRARGRVMQDHERLEDLHVVPYELVHLLPQPPIGSGVQERPPEYPLNRGYAGAGWGSAISGLVLVLVFTAVWGLGLVQVFHPDNTDVGWTDEVARFAMSLLPPMALALLVTSFARHLLGGRGSSIQVPGLAFVMVVPMWIVALVPLLVLVDLEPTQIALVAVPAVLAGFLGIILGWLAWYGAVEPLPKVTKAAVQKQEAEAVYPCGICGLPVAPEVRAGCQFGCGRVFHSGCLQARTAVHKGAGCAVCGFVPG
jgi:hypothetical protein